MYCKKTQTRIATRRVGYWEGSQGQGSLFAVFYCPVYHSIKKSKADSFDWLAKYKSASEEADLIF